MHTGHPVGGWKGIEPERAVFQKVYEHQSRQVFEWEDIHCTPSAVLQGSDILFDLRHVLVCHTAVQHWERWSQDLKLRVAGDGCHAKTAMVIQLDHLLQTCGDSPHLMVWERFHHAEAKIL